MVTIEELRKEIAEEKVKEKEIRLKVKLEEEKIGLQRELKVYRRSPAQKRNIRLINRTVKGFKGLVGEAKNFTIKQAERIRKQQLRDNEMLRKRSKSIKKKKGKKFNNLNNNVFQELDF